MSRGNQLYDRPDLTQRMGKLALYVNGTLPTARPSSAYAGRLPIHNAIGACSVEVLEGVIPPGGQVYVDNTTSEIVVAWPAYSETPSPPDNAGFETGDLTGWTYSTIGGSGAPVVTGNHHNSGSYAAYWAGGKGLGSEGGIECVLLNDKACVAYPGQTINFKATILYNPDGGTPKGSRGQVRLNWYDGDGNLIDTSYGDLIKTRAHNGKWTASNGRAKGPPGTKSARLAVWLTATGAGHSYCDDATWDAPAIVGTKDEGTINLWLRVHDAGGRVADWTGQLTIATYNFTWVFGDVLPDRNIGRIFGMHVDFVNKALIASNDYKMCVSENGATWTITNSPAIGSQAYCIGASNGVIYIWGAGKCYKSLDKINWTEVLVPNKTNTGMMSFPTPKCVISSEHCVLALYYYASGESAFFSDDGGQTWVRPTSVPSGFNPGDSASRFKGIYVPNWQQWIIPGQGKLYVADGELPNTITEAISSTPRIGPVAYSPELDTAVVAGYSDVYTKVGRYGNWMAATSIVTVESVVWAASIGLFVAFFGTANYVYTSSDGLVWTRRNSGFGFDRLNQDAVWVPWLQQMVVLRTNYEPYRPYLSNI